MSNQKVPLATISPEQLRAIAQMRVLHALDRIQQAQSELLSACEQLSSLVGATTLHRATGKLYDRVHALWYRVDSFRNKGRYRLDDSNVRALLKKGMPV